MTTVTFDSAAIGINFLLVFLALFVGLFAGIAGSLAVGFGSLVVGVAEAIASGGQTKRREDARRNKGLVALRAVIWFAMICGSFALVIGGYPWIGHTCGIFGSICLPIAVIKLFSQS